MRSFGRIFLIVSLAVTLAAPIESSGAKIDCTDTYLGNRTPTATGVAASGQVRVFALQYRLDLVYMQTYATFRHKMECLLLDYVVPKRSQTKPNIVVLNEDTGLPVLGLGRVVPLVGVLDRRCRDDGSQHVHRRASAGQPAQDLL